MIGQTGLVQSCQQVGTFFVVQVGQVQHGFAPRVDDAVVLKVQVVHRVNLRHARHQHATSVNAQMLKIGNVDLKTILVNAVQRPSIVLRRGAGEIPIGKHIVGAFAQKMPVNHATGVDKMNLDIRRAGRLLQIKARRRKARQRIQRPALQQLGQGALQGHLKTRMRAKTGKATLVFGMQQGHVHDRVLPAQRCVFDQDAKSGGAQGGDTGRDARVSLKHRFRHIGQADALADDLAFDVALKNLRQRLGARLGCGIACRHAVAHIQVAHDVDRNIGCRAVALAGVRHGANAPPFVARIELDQVACVDMAFRVV